MIRYIFKVDRCLVWELLKLNYWYRIKTYNSCCGHTNVGCILAVDPYIQVRANSRNITKLQRAGYSIQHGSDVFIHRVVRINIHPKSGCSCNYHGTSVGKSKTCLACELKKSYGADKGWQMYLLMTSDIKEEADINWKNTLKRAEEKRRNMDNLNTDRDWNGMPIYPNSIEHAIDLTKNGYKIIGFYSGRCDNYIYAKNGDEVVIYHHQHMEYYLWLDKKLDKNGVKKWVQVEYSRRSE